MSFDTSGVHAIALKNRPIFRNRSEISWDSLNVAGAPGVSARIVEADAGIKVCLARPQNRDGRADRARIKSHFGGRNEYSTESAVEFQPPVVTAIVATRM